MWEDTDSDEDEEDGMDIAERHAVEFLKRLKVVNKL